MRPEVQVLPGPPIRAPVRVPTLALTEVTTVNKALILAAGALGALVAVLRRRKSQADAALWREATSDTSR